MIPPLFYCRCIYSFELLYIKNNSTQALIHIYKELFSDQYVLQFLESALRAAMDTVFCGELVDVGGLIVGFRRNKKKGW